MRSASVLLATLLCAAVAPFLTISGDHTGPQVPFPGWMSHWKGQPLERLPLSEREAKFADGFSGKVARFTGGEHQYVIRWVRCRTRQLHPAGDCFRGSGYTVRPLPIRVEGDGERWGCFEAARPGETFDVCERIFDHDGSAWTDVSAWYWAATMGQSAGAWWAVTRVAAKP